MKSEPLRHERAVWETFPSWRHFTWLYLFSALAIVRGGLLIMFGLPGASVWFIGALLLVGVAALLRRWARYAITPRRVIVRNGYTGREISVIHLDQVKDVEVLQGKVAGALGIGTVLINSSNDDRQVRLQGIRDPDVVKARILALRPAYSAAT